MPTSAAPAETAPPRLAGTRAPSKIAVEQVLVIFLPSRLRLRLDFLLGDSCRNRLERRAGLEHRLRFGLLPAGVALRALCVELAVFNHIRGRNQRRRANIDAAD